MYYCTILFFGTAIVEKSMQQYSIYKDERYARGRVYLISHLRTIVTIRDNSGC